MVVVLCAVYCVLYAGRVGCYGHVAKMTAWAAGLNVCDQSVFWQGSVSIDETCKCMGQSLLAADDQQL
jgi:hypothetical protein